MRMRSKLLLLCLGSTILALFLQTFLFQRASSELIYKQAKEESFGTLKNMQNEIYTFIRNMESNLIDIYNNKEFIQTMRSEAPADQIRQKYYRLAFSFATENFDTSDGVVSFYIYNKKHEALSAYRRAVTPKHNYPRDIYQDEEKFNAGKVREYFAGDDTNMLISGYYNDSRETNIVRFVLKIYDNANINDKIGYVVCDADSKVLKKIIEKYRTQNEMFIWLQPLGDRQLLSSGMLEDSSREYFEENVERIREGTLDAYGDFIAGKQVLFRVSQNKYNLDAYSLMPQSLLEANQRLLTRNLIFIMLLMSAVITGLAVWMAGGLVKPLEELTRTIAQIRSGNTRQRVCIAQKDEIGKLSQEFNEMLDEIERLIGHEYETKLLLNKAEYNALQAQINPHFLYNTLDTMSSIASIQNCSMVSDLCQSLSNIFRYSLDYKHPYSTIAKEMLHLKNYIFVMNVRMREDVKYIFDIDENILKDSIPRISIQPLVENALKHGLRDKKGEKRIEVSAKGRNGLIQIIVKDNGVGMETAAINEMLENSDGRENGETTAGNSIGLSNINARMKMLYGKDYGLHIESTRDEGTRVILTIPRVRTEEVETWQKEPINY